MDMDRKSWERRNSDIALYETNQQLESQRLELCQANQWADQAQRQNIRLFGELSTKSKISKLRGSAREQLDTACRIFRNGSRTSENLEDAELPAPANISHDSDSKRLVKVVSRKHSNYTHCPKAQNCEVCKRTKITMAPCRRRTGESVLLAEKFGDLTAADHKILNEGCEPRNNHRYSVVVQV